MSCHCPLGASKQGAVAQRNDPKQHEHGSAEAAGLHLRLHLHRPHSACMHTCQVQEEDASSLRGAMPRPL
jgi:hypothetical protein